MVRPRGTGVRRLAGFDESLRLLLVDEQYSVTDIAMMFDISRERVRQLRDQIGIPFVKHRKSVGLHCTRLWDDTLHRFRPVSNRDLRTADAHLRERKVFTTVTDRHAERVQRIRDLRVSLGRDPSWREMWMVVEDGVERRERIYRDFASRVLLMCGFRKRRLKTIYHLAAFRLATGTARADRTKLGLSRPLGLRCRRGHLFSVSNTAYRPNGDRECRKCRAFRRQGYRGRVGTL